VNDATFIDLEDWMASLRRYARMLARNPADADDLVQESLVRSIERLREPDCVGNPGAYLFTVLRNCHRELSARMARAPKCVPIDDISDSIACSPAQTWRIELGDLVAALNRLPKEQREVLVMVGIDGMTYGEASAAIDVPIGTVMSRLSRGREVLRRWFPESNGQRQSGIDGSRPSRLVRQDNELSK
jgi:RNA polymerase sigma-70 factor (ECF subfamily)